MRADAERLPSSDGDLLPAYGCSRSGERSCGRPAGFTLIELMLVIAIAGILAAVGLPAFQETLANQRAKSAASELHLSLLLARSEAIKRSSNIQMAHSGSAWTDGWVVRVASDGTVLRTNDAVNGVDLDCSSDSLAASACPATITFNRSGRPTAFFEFWSYVNDQSTVKMRCVSMSLSGRPRVVLDGDSDTTNGCG